MCEPDRTLGTRTLGELLDRAIGTPTPGVLDLCALYRLLSALLDQLGLRQAPAHSLDRTGPGPGPGPGAGPGPGPGSGTVPGPGPSPGHGPGPDRWTLRGRVDSCEQDVSQAMVLVQQLQVCETGLREELQMLRSPAETLQDVEQCCHRVDALEEALTSLQSSVQLSAEREEQCVTWEEVQVLLGEVEEQQRDEEAAEQDPAGPLPPQRPPQAELALQGVTRLRERLRRLEARLAALEEGRRREGQLRERLHLEAAHEATSSLTEKLKQQTSVMSNLMTAHDKSMQLLSELQQLMQQLQVDCAALQADARTQRSHQEELLRVTQQLEERKVDKQLLENEMRVALDGSVPRLQFEAVTERLQTSLQQLLSRVSVQERDWSRVVDELSTQLDCKLNRMELDLVKKQLEGRWKNLQQKLQEQEAAEQQDAAALRKKLVDRFHCLSCDRPVVKYISTQPVVTLPSSPGFPARSVRPFTVFALEQFRQHCRSERVSALTDVTRLTVSRSCGGSHTVTSAGRPRAAGGRPQHSDADGVLQSEEVDIIGLDGHIYKGRVKAPAARAPETRLPTISSRDGFCKSRDGARSSPPHRPAATPEDGAGPGPGPGPGAREVRCSRSACSSSARDWPVSLGSTSQVSESAEAQAEEQLHL